MTFSGDLAVQFHALNIATLAFFFSIVLVLVGLPLFERCQSGYLASARQKILWVFALTPWITGTVSFYVAYHCFGETEASTRPFHFFHSYHYDFFSWHSIPTTLFIGLVCFSILKCLLRISMHIRALKTLTFFSGNKAVNEIETPALYAFTSGFLSPRIFISKNLRNTLEQHELLAVIEHEKAHQYRRDPLRKLVFSILTGFFPRITRQQLENQLYLAIEQSADEYAARQINDETAVASALLKITKKSKSHTDLASCGEYCAFVSDEIKGRMYYLLSPQQHKRFPYVLVLFTLLIVVTGNLISANAFHHFTESFFHS